MDIISLPIEFEKKKLDSRYRLVIAAAMRAKDLSQGARPKIESKAKKHTTVALQEIISNSVNILTGEAAINAEERAKKLIPEYMMDEAKQKETLHENLTELEKDLKVYLHEKSEQFSTQRKKDDFLREEGSK
ncbi:MAG: DNA-directed RNA polymerase subunit omega [Nitrospirae bacterium]|nr:DNA-directed RNA polymerase subunit omega [Nitrospirota bacterium]